MSDKECRESCDVYKKWLEDGQKIIELTTELKILKSPLIKTMTMCECKERYRLPSAKVCDKCKIAELETSNIKYQKRAKDAEAELAKFNIGTREQVFGPSAILPITLPKKACPCPYPQCVSDDRRCGDMTEPKKEPTFLPECKWQGRHSNRVTCECVGVTAIECDKNCRYAEPKKDEVKNG